MRELPRSIFRVRLASEESFVNERRLQGTYKIARQVRGFDYWKVREFREFDAWLRADGHRRNPGTTADLIAASLFAAFRDGILPMPSLDDIQNEVQLWGPNDTTSA